MNRFGIAIGIALMAATQVGARQQASTAAAPAATGAISGVVTDAVTGRPVAGAMIMLGLTTGGPVHMALPRTSTDPKGRFVFRDLAPNTRYYLTAGRVGYATTRYGTSAPQVPTFTTEIRTVDDVAVIALAADQWVSDISIPLWRLGSLSGRVVDERQEPVVGVVVRAFSARRIAGHTQFVASDLATTDDRGEYRLNNLVPGSYAVAALSVQSTVLSSAPEGQQIRALGELTRATATSTGLPTLDGDGGYRLAISNYATPPPPASDGARAYPPLYYPETTSIATAQTVDVGYGDAKRGIDFNLRPVPAVTVSGRVTATVGFDPFLLRLMPSGSEQLGVGAEVATTWVDRDGSFTFLNVPSGDYTVLAQSAILEFTRGGGEASVPNTPGAPQPGGTLGWMTGAPGLTYTHRTGKVENFWGRLPLSVGARNVTNLILPLHPTVNVRGRVVAADDLGRRASVYLAAYPANGDPTLGQSPVLGTEAAIGTPFSIGGLMDGTYLLSLTLGRSGPAIQSIIWEGRDVRDTGLDASLGRDFDDVVITVTNKSIELSGSVRGARHEAAPAVIAFPVDRARWIDYGLEPLRIRSRSADSNGAYVVQGLPEGDYFVIAVDSSQHDAWTDPKFLEAASGLATRVSLKWGDKKAVDLTVATVVIK